ncbi:MAG TPA: hypothetical protein VJK26_03120 [Patescibacteria group bacterium]|nr:hypothetical protein [Patescibacteria group bacterium]
MLVEVMLNTLPGCPIVCVELRAIKVAEGKVYLKETEESFRTKCNQARWGFLSQNPELLPPRDG